MPPLFHVSQEAQDDLTASTLFRGRFTSVLRISRQTVTKVLKQEARKVKPTPLGERFTELEVDEMWTFVEKKDYQRWIWYAFDSRSKKILRFVIGDRTEKTGRKLFKKLERSFVLRFCTDNWEAYQNIIPEYRHWIGKRWTQDIERQNLNLRTHLKRLQRKTICFSKTDEMLNAIVKLYINDWNNRQQHI